MKTSSKFFSCTLHGHTVNMIKHVDRLLFFLNMRIMFGMEKYTFDLICRHKSHLTVCVDIHQCSLKRRICPNSADRFLFCRLARLAPISSVTSWMLSYWWQKICGRKLSAVWWSPFLSYRYTLLYKYCTYTFNILHLVNYTLYYLFGLIFRGKFTQHCS